MAFPGPSPSFTSVVTPTSKTTVTGAATTIDLSLSNTHHIEVADNTTFTFSNPRDGQKYVFILEQTVGSKTITWDGKVVWKAGTTPTLSTTANKIDIVGMVYLAHTDKYYAECSLDF